MTAWLIRIPIIAGVLAVATILVVALVINLGGGEDALPRETRGQTGQADDAAPTPEGAETEEVRPSPGGDVPEAEGVERRDPQDPLAVGAVDAPVVMVVFSDYQCPHCAQWNEETLPAMLEHAEAGDLRIEWRDMTFLGDGSERAALASYAAAKQDAFREYHEQLFLDGQPRPESELSDAALVELAEELGLDGERFAADMASAEAASAIAENEQLASEAGVTGTPTVVIAGEQIAGAQPVEVYEDAFEAALGDGR